jgi:hypothetical protein
MRLLCLFVVVESASAACATSHAARIPPQAVIVFEKDAGPPANCSRIGNIKARDGYIGSPWDFKEGSRARALDRLRRTAASKGGTAVLIRDEPELICVDCWGSVVEIVADVLRCG